MATGQQFRGKIEVFVVLDINFIKVPSTASNVAGGMLRLAPSSPDGGIFCIGIVVRDSTELRRQKFRMVLRPRIVPGKRAALFRHHLGTTL